jgi:hypothetical protein
LQRTIGGGTYPPSDRFSDVQPWSKIMVPAPIRDWGDALFTSITQALALFLAAIPKVVGFLIIIAIG